MFRHYGIFLILIFSLLVGILFLLQSIQAATPPDLAYGTHKPANFPTRLPWTAGMSHLIGWAYGVCNPTDLSQGDHCNAINGSQDYYALDF